MPMTCRRFLPFSPALLSATRQPDPGPGRHTLIHMHWQPWEPSAPTWRRWLDAARGDDPELATGMDTLSFREELHAIEAVISGPAP